MLKDYQFFVAASLFDRLLLAVTGWSQTCCVIQAGRKFMILPYFSEWNVRIMGTCHHM